MSLFNAPKNINYCATVVKIEKLVPLIKCDNVVGAIIFGNQVIVGKDTKIGDTGLYFPVECRLSSAYLHANNLYNSIELNADTKQKGYFDRNGRVRCQRFRGNKSEGLYMPLSSLAFICDVAKLKVGDSFDVLNDVEICAKYIVSTRQAQQHNKSDKKIVKRLSKMIEGQFRLAVDTAALYRNIGMLDPNHIISISRKIHGCNFAAGNVMVKKKLTIPQRIFRFFGADINDTTHDLIYASRRVVKNEYLDDPKSSHHYYGYDLWKEAAETIRGCIEKDITLYAELCGYTKDGGYIQKGYHYGCEKGKNRLFIYRVVKTGASGVATEYTFPMLEEYCKRYGLEPVPLLYYGRARDLYNIPIDKHWHEEILARLKADYVEGKMCRFNPELPDEGICLRIEAERDAIIMKLKNSEFLERETALLNEEYISIEDEN